MGKTKTSQQKVNKEKTPIITKYYSCDFETTVYDDQERTDVWAAAIVDLDDPDEPEYVKIFGTIESFFFYVTQKLTKLGNIVLYFHNLKFDGSFIMDYLKHSDYWQEDSYEVINEETGESCGKALNRKKFNMNNGYYRYSISDKGMWYSITLRTKYRTIEIRDSLKLLPFSVRKIGKDFQLKHQKLDMEYEGFRYPGCKISEKERSYIANDVLIVKEALNFMFSQGHDQLTIGACCLKEYQSYFTKDQWNELFPNLYEVEIPELPGMTQGDYIRKSYKGGWCYTVPEIKGKDLRGIGTTCDVNSLYPSVMHSDSGNRYPVGIGTYWQGDVPKEAKAPDKYYFLHIKCRFYIKDGKLPTIQIKGNTFYPSREWLISSDVIDRRMPAKERYKIENRSRFIRESDGSIQPARPDLYLTMTDWELMKKQYKIEELEIIDGIYFDTRIGLFDEYINKYAEIKQNSTGSRRELAKLLLNNLYGKMATSPDSSYKVMYLNDNDMLRSYSLKAFDKQPGYIAIGSAITSYARSFTVTAAQLNYHPGKPGFCYSDTDSIHCNVSPDKIKGAPKHPTKFLHWKYETTWDYAKFMHAKTYVEHVVQENEKDVEPWYNLKCAGMSDDLKELFIHSVLQDLADYDNLDKEQKKYYDKLDKEQKAFIAEKRTFDDFDYGLVIPGQLKAHNIKGGTLLKKQEYTMHPPIGD